MSEPEPKKPRVRSKNFSIAEIELLKSSVTEHFDVITAKHCNGASGVTKKIQDGAWGNICKSVNSVGVTQRCVGEVKEKWRNLTKKAKSEVTFQKISASKTGGGPPVPLPDPLLEGIACLYQASAAFHGIPGALDSETVISLCGENDGLDFGSYDVLDITGPNPAKINEDDSKDVPQKMNDNYACLPSTSKEPEAQIPSTEPPLSSSEIVKPKTTERTQRSLKDAQTEYFQHAAENEKLKKNLIKEQTALYHNLNKTMPKIHAVLDSLLNKMKSTEEWQYFATYTCLVIKVSGSMLFWIKVVN